MASMTATAAAEARLAPARRPAARAPARRHVSGGVAWIVVFGILLAGVVAINVAVLQSNLRLDQLGQERTKLRAENAALQSQVSAAAAGPRISALAARQLGLQLADQTHTSYVGIVP